MDMELLQYVNILKFDSDSHGPVDRAGHWSTDSSLVSVEGPSMTPRVPPRQFGRAISMIWIEYEHLNI